MARYREEQVQVTTQSLTQADASLERIIHKICQQKWETEVVQKKGKKHSINYVLSQAQDCYFVEPDPNKTTT